jgi:hypothetical protein
MAPRRARAVTPKEGCCRSAGAGGRADRALAGALSRLCAAFPRGRADRRRRAERTSSPSCRRSPSQSVSTACTGCAARGAGARRARSFRPGGRQRLRFASAGGCYHPRGQKPHLRKRVHRCTAERRLASSGRRAIEFCAGSQVGRLDALEIGAGAEVARKGRAHLGDQEAATAACLRRSVDATGSTGTASRPACAPNLPPRSVVCRLDVVRPNPRGGAGIRPVCLDWGCAARGGRGLG